MKHEKCECKCTCTVSESTSHKSKKKAHTKSKQNKEKKSRQPTAYSMFVKENYNKVRYLPVKSRFKELSEMWKKENK